jgi:hypothetical protein
MDIKPIYRYIYIEHNLNINNSTGSTKTIHLNALDQVVYNIKKLPEGFKNHMDLFLNIDNIEITNS